MHGSNQEPAKQRRPFWPIALAVFAVVFAGNLAIKGYRPQNLNYTEDQMVRIAIQQAMQQVYANTPKVVPNVNLTGSKPVFYKPAHVIPYKDVEHFLAENPDCYTIDNRNGYVTVKIRGKIFYRDMSRQILSSDTQSLHSAYFSNKVHY